jgi:uncharacterized protein Yka (UPF0111/DUF47 family)
MKKEEESIFDLTDSVYTKISRIEALNAMVIHAADSGEVLNNEHFSQIADIVAESIEELKESVEKIFEIAYEHDLDRIWSGIKMTEEGAWATREVAVKELRKMLGELDEIDKYYQQADPLRKKVEELLQKLTKKAA